MSEAIVLNAELRKDVGKGASRRLRHAEKLPAIIYGANAEATQITLMAKDVRKAQESEAFYAQIVTLNVEGKTEQAILKDIQRHPAKEFAMHMDFLRVDAATEITTNVPLHFINEDICAGAKAGGAITHNMVEVEVRCLPKDLPEFIEVDMEAVELGGSVHLSELKVAESVKLVHLMHGEDHDLPVAGVQAVRATKEDVADEAAEGEGESSAE
ncbi:50S ribosomal protein L25/general stress protein Ctc [Kistimonas asteriae]|uniref:50S ribosomal protein L25/general stress protein Ctc n=1 Tax=Kistimonas asteriae TaxID=517724 RepID=UPI001BA4D8F1|nr:50S ribosomal protein L25/general stress protein Ctc [Kistimonas asteriae]